MQTVDSIDYAPSPNAARLAHMAKKSPWYPALEEVTRPTVTTREAAYYLNRAEQTLRTWSMNEDGPLLPRRINGRLAWPVADIRRMVGG